MYQNTDAWLSRQQQVVMDMADPAGPPLVDWAGLPPELLLFVSKLLERQDIKKAATACKSWNDGAREQLLHELQGLLFYMDASSDTRPQGRLLDLRRALRRCPAGTLLSLLFTERHMPNLQQITAALEAVSQHPHVTRLSIDWEEHASASKLSQECLNSIISRMCVQLAARAQHVTSLQVNARTLTHTSRIPESLALLQQLQQLRYISAGPRSQALNPLTALTSLTSLQLGWSRDKGAISQPLGDTLQQLAALSKLVSLKLTGNLLRLPSHPHLLALPAWQHLRHLHLVHQQQHQQQQQDDGVACDLPYILQLSTQHCASLESLTTQCFCVEPGVTSIAQLTQLDAWGPPAVPLQHPPPQQQRQQGERPASFTAAVQPLTELIGLRNPQHLPPLLPRIFPAVQRIGQMLSEQEEYAPEPLQQLRHLCQQLMGTLESVVPRPQQQVSFPALQQLTLGCEEPAQCMPGAVAALLQQAPALLELDLRRAERSACAVDVDAAEEQQAVHELLCREQPLRSLRLPCYSRLAPLPSSVQWLLQPAALHGRLRSLALQHPLPPHQYPLLRALTSLRELHVAYNSAALLAHLPEQLTALRWGPVTKDQAAPQQLAAASKVPPLRRLHLHLRTPDSNVLRVLPLSRLAGLTSLSLACKPLGEEGQEEGAAAGAARSAADAVSAAEAGPAGTAAAGAAELAAAPSASAAESGPAEAAAAVPGMILLPDQAGPAAIGAPAACAAAVAAPGIGLLPDLVELEAPVWPGMAQQLAGLGRLRRLQLWLKGRQAVSELAQQVEQLGGLTQLRRLRLWDGCEGGAAVVEQRQMLAALLPACVVGLSVAECPCGEDEDV